MSIHNANNAGQGAVSRPLPLDARRASERVIERVIALQARSAAPPLGLISDIQRFSLHDGPGIRTTVFLKGCNMRCAWCHNPETIASVPQVLLRPERCIGCGMCDQGCFSGARTLCGVQMSVDDVLREIVQDRAYYGSDGGVTVSGGEPGCQPQFTCALLDACRREGIHRAVESNMSLPLQTMRKIWTRCDLILADLKLLDDEKHRVYTGIGNERVRENIRACSADGIPIILHTPVIVGINDTVDEIRGIASFARQLPTLICYELLPYNPLGLAKGRLEDFEPMAFETPSRDRMLELARAAKAQGIAVRIAGEAI